MRKGRSWLRIRSRAQRLIKYNHHSDDQQRRGGEDHNGSGCGEQRESEAEQMIRDANLTVAHGEAQYDDNVAEGNVISSNPVAEQRLKRDRQ